MAEQFYTILTAIGKAKVANSGALGTKVNFVKFKVGDGNGSYYNPTENQTELKNQVWEGNISSIYIDEENSNWIVIEAVIPTLVGGFTIREAGVFDDEGNLIAIGKYPETYKPVSSDGSTKDLLMRMILEVSNAENINLKVDPTIILATKKDIQVLESKFDKKIEEINAHLNDLTYETAGGTGTAITLTMQPLKQGYNKTFIASANNNAAATTINGKNLYKPGTTTSPKLIEGKAYTVWYNSVGDCFFIKASAEGTATSSHVLAGYTFSNDDDTGLLGDIVNRGTLNKVLALNETFNLPAGYYPGGKVTQNIPNNGAINANLNCGQSKSLPAGYISGGTITANSLASQTPANADAGTIVAGRNAWVNGNLINGTARPILNYAEGSYTFGASYNNLYLDLGVIPISYDFIYGVLNVDFINVMNSSVVKTDTKEVLIFPWNGAIYSMYPKYQTAATDPGSPAFALRNEYNNTVQLVNANYSTGNTNCKVQGTFTWKAYKLK